MIGVANGFNRHELVLEINYGDLGHFGGIIQFLQSVYECQRFLAARLLRNSFQTLR